MSKELKGFRFLHSSLNVMVHSVSIDEGESPRIAYIVDDIFNGRDSLIDGLVINFGDFTELEIKAIRDHFLWARDVPQIAKGS